MRTDIIGPESSIETTPCLCRVLFGGMPEKHRIRYSRQCNKYIIFCPSCGFMTRPDSNLQSVKADWICSNRSGDAHIVMLWERRLAELKKSGPAGPLEQGPENEAYFQ